MNKIVKIIGVNNFNKFELIYDWLAFLTYNFKYKFNKKATDSTEYQCLPEIQMLFLKKKSILIFFLKLN